MIRQPPFLNHPISGWRRDLPSPNDPISNLSERDETDITPQKSNISYIEFNITTFKVRGILAWLGIILVIASLILLQNTISLFANPIIRFDFFHFSIATFTCVAAFWYGVVAFRTDVFLPRHESIRFNRHRKRVYYYHYKTDWKKPFSREWRVHVAVYSWENMHAETCQAYGAMGTGGHMEAVMLSALLPGTRDIAHRFLFSHDIAEGTLNWEIARQFMQTGQLQNLHPKINNNKRAPLNLFWRFAPKVEWPTNIDLESRTAPGEH